MGGIRSATSCLAVFAAVSTIPANAIDTVPSNVSPFASPAGYGFRLNDAGDPALRELT